MYVVCVLSVSGGFACAAGENGSEPPPEPAEVVIEPYACTPLAGTYRVVYARRSGDCADLPEQLAFFDGRESISALSDDCEATVSTSEDDCDREEDAVCQVLSENGGTIGTATLVTAFTQTSAVRIEGMATIAVDTAAADCTATYALIGSKVIE